MDISFHEYIVLLLFNVFVQFGCLWALWTYIGNIKQVDLQTKTQNSPF